MPPPRKPGMTANPVRPARHRPGKAIGEASASSSSSEEDEDSESEEEERKRKEQQQQQQKQKHAAPPAPKASSFPSSLSSKASRIAADLSNVDLNERRKLAAAAERRRVEEEARRKAEEEEGFETEESEEDGSEEGEEEDESGSEEESGESSSEDERTKALKNFRPVYIKKDDRVKMAAWKKSSEAREQADEERRAQEEERKKAELDVIIQENYEKDRAARAAGKKDWDAEDLTEIDDVDDTDDIDPEAELAAWKLRELRRVKREREALIAAEKEREEVERRRNLTAEEREAEDKELLDKQKEDREARGPAGFMQRYHHKGAFYQDEAAELGLNKRDLMGARFEDEVKNREVLPEYMQIRDQTRLGRKGRTRYKDLRSEDTGRWGESKGGWVAGRKLETASNGRFGDRDRDDRYGDSRGKEGPTGANSAPVGERKRPAEGYGGRYRQRSRSRSREDKRARID